MRKRKIIFPPVDTASDEGLVAVGGDLEIDTLLTAYRQGIFPWPLSSYPLNVGMPNTWFSPDPRGVLQFKHLHMPKSFVKFLKKTPFHVTFNKAFAQVIANCAKMPRKDQPGTWITPEIIAAYTELFHQGHAYSVEVWDNEELVGGLYGVIIGSFVSGESMFHHADNASKQGLYALVTHLQDKGIEWLDTQMITPVVQQLGGKYIPRAQFIEMLRGVVWEIPRSTYFLS